jgi:branched-chain amino acid transport system ATP-binding protein
MSLLATRTLTAFYGDFQALYGVDVDIEPGETVAIIGANGAGKTTLLRTLAGQLSTARNAVSFEGRDIGGLRAAEVMKLGIAMVPEGRKLFPSLSVEENLRIGGDHAHGVGRWRLETIYDLFPVLAERRHRPGTALSGGQQQMVAIGRALMSNPKLLLCDEISLGLAPIVINDIYAALPKIQAAGAGIVLVEQDIARALGVSSRVFCLQEGRVTLRGRPSDLTREAIQEAYFGH